MNMFSGWSFSRQTGLRVIKRTGKVPDSTRRRLRFVRLQRGKNYMVKSFLIKSFLPFYLQAQKDNSSFLQERNKYIKHPLQSYSPASVILSIPSFSSSPFSIPFADQHVVPPQIPPRYTAARLVTTIRHTAINTYTIHTAASPVACNITVGVQCGELVCFIVGQGTHLPGSHMQSSASVDGKVGSLQSPKAVYDEQGLKMFT